MAACQWHLRSIHEAPMRIVTKNADGEVVKRRARHAVLDLLDEPNEYYDGQTLLAMMSVSRILDGNGYALKIRDASTNEVFQIWYEPHFTIRPRCYGDGISDGAQILVNDGKFISFYEVYRPAGLAGASGQWFRMEVEDVVHTRVGIDPYNPMKGLSPFAALLADVYTDMQRAHFTATVLSNIGMIPFVVSPRDAGSSIKRKEAEVLKQSLEQQARQDRGKPIVAGRAIRIDELGFSPRDMDLGALASIPEEHVAACLGPNAYVLGFIPENSIFSNYIEARRDAMESYSVPLHKRLARDFTRDLFREWEQDKNVTLEYDFRNVLAMAEYWEGQFDMWGKAYQDGIAKRYDARKALLLPVEEKKSDEEPGDHVYSKPGTVGFQEEKEEEPLAPPPKGQLKKGDARTATTRGNERPRSGQDRGPVLGGKPPRNNN
jgi:phage portal protein BeeE